VEDTPPEELVHCISYLSLNRMIHITTLAATQIRNLASKKENSENNGLRLSIEAGGCAGLQYTMILSLKKADDITVEYDGVKVFIDTQSSQELAGCTLDYEEGLASSGFRIINPQAVRSCGCGTSFESKNNPKSSSPTR